MLRNFKPPCPGSAARRAPTRRRAFRPDRGGMRPW